MATENMPLIEGINPQDYQYFGLWKCNAFADYFWAAWDKKEYFEELSIPNMESGVLILNGGNFFVKKSAMAEAEKLITEKVLAHDEHFFKTFIEFSNNLYSRSLKQSEEAVGLASDKEFFAELVRIGENMMFPWFLGWLFCEVYDPLLHEAARRCGIIDEKISEHIPLIRTPLMDQQAELRSLKQLVVDKGIWEKLKENPAAVVAAIEGDNHLASLLEKHIKQYAWVQIFNYLGDDISIENILDQMTHLNEKPAAGESTTSTPTDFSYYAAAASSLSYMRQTGAEYFSMYSQMIMPRLKGLAQSGGLAYAEFLELVPQEISLLLDGQLDPRPIIERRKGPTWCIYADAHSRIRIIDDAVGVARLSKAMMPAVDENEGIIKGQVGNKGFITGKIKIILANTEFDKMEVGDVLVTTMTTPDFVILMQKASAIITDIGGLLCHAAIVSRELNKPCVIGTKNATQLLQDGDVVEVDANKGIVRKIELS